MKIKNKVTIILLILSHGLFSGCKKFIEIDKPIESSTAEQSFKNTIAASRVVTGLYAAMANENLISTSSTIRLSFLTDELKPDDYVYQNGPYINDYENQGAIDELWMNSYRILIFRCNSAIEGLTKSLTLNETIKQRLIAEVKVVRAFTYFYLVNLYGDVPLVLTTDYKINASMPRTTTDVVYDQIENDLKDAEDVLSNNYLSADITTNSTDRIRPNKATASALLARVYLYRQRWAEAEIEATKVIQNNNYELLNVDEVFLKNSKETIWSLQPNPHQENGRVNTMEGRFFLPEYEKLIAVSPQLMNNFENKDKRRDSWLTIIDNRFIPNKYKIGELPNFQDQVEYSIMFRLSEQYLIRAEARAQLSKIDGLDGGEADLNKIRTRAGLSALTSLNQHELLKAIEKERFTELFVENGHRWLDLKRTGRVNDIMEVVTPLKGGQWQPFKAFLPIPYYEFSTNPSLIGHQNQGFREQP